VIEQEKKEGEKTCETSNASQPMTPSAATDDQRNPAASQTKTDKEIADLERQIGRNQKGMLRWTAVVGIFTIVLCAFTGLQTYSFIESERAFFVLTDLQFIYGDPTGMESNRDFLIVLKNVGKHLSKVGKVEAAPIYGVVKKTLPEILATQKPPLVSYVMAPVAPDSDTKIFAEVRRTKPQVADDFFMSGLRNGSIPLWFYGFVEYDIGYPSFNPGKLGFCMKYVPPSIRKPWMSMFLVCEYPQYTYTQ